MLQSLTKHGSAAALKGVETALGVAYPKPIRFIAGYNIDYIIHIKKMDTTIRMTIRMTDNVTFDAMFNHDTPEYRDCQVYLETQNMVDYVQNLINDVKKEVE